PCAAVPPALPVPRRRRRPSLRLPRPPPRPALFPYTTLFRSPARCAFWTFLPCPARGRAGHCVGYCLSHRHRRVTKHVLPCRTALPGGFVFWSISSKETV